MNEKIYYNEDLPEGVEPLYNGNIADVYYSAHDSAHFRLSYDGLNRLTASQQYTRDGVKTAAAEAFTYDKMGNITSIVRSTQNPQPDYINRVQLFYDGNRIIRGEGSPYSGGYNDMVYPNLVGKDVEYEYDPNGNLIKNEDNRISLTTYNLLNLPQTVAFSDKSLSVFYYMADGRKIRNATGAYSISTAVPIDSVVKNTDPYISYMSEWNDEYWYQGKQQKYINTPEGNIEVSTGRKMSFSYYYTSKDHLGSIWHYWNSLSNKYSNIYYPSGIMREKRRSPFNYGLTGKEIVYDNGLDEYFFGARTLFAPINRFNQPDPLCEEYYHISPYAYCANNFINALDPDGKDPIYAKNFWGKIKLIGDDGQKSTGSYLVRGSVAREVKAATKSGNFYTGNLSESKNVMHIPTGQIQQDVQRTATAALNSGTSPETRVEYGGHVLFGDTNARIWDAGTTMQTQILSDGSTEKKWSVKPFKIGGKNNQFGGLISQIQFFWHIHPNGSTPSRGDIWWVGELRKYGFTGNSFLIDINNNRVIFFNEKGSLMNIKYDDFKRMGKQEDIK